MFDNGPLCTDLLQTQDGMSVFGRFRTEVGLTFSRTITLFLTLLAIFSMASAAMPTVARAQTMPPGTLGWQWGTNYYPTSEEACYAQWQQYHGTTPDSRFIGTFQSDQPDKAFCKYTSYQYLCPQETGGSSSSCGTVVASSVYFKCTSGYQMHSDGLCVPTAFYFPELPCDKCDRISLGATLNPSVGDPIGVHTGAVARSETDFATDDGLFRIKRR